MGELKDISKIVHWDYNPALLGEIMEKPTIKMRGGVVRNKEEKPTGLHFRYTVRLTSAKGQFVSAIAENRLQVLNIPDFTMDNLRDAVRFSVIDAQNAFIRKGQEEGFIFPNIKFEIPTLQAEALLFELQT